MLTLLRHPDVLGRLRHEPDLIIPLVEELLRYEPPVQFVATRTAVVVDADPARASATTRKSAVSALSVPSYLNNLRELGFSDSDFESGGSDALIDAVVPRSEPESLAERIREHHRAGADHVAVHPLARTLDQQLEDLRRLAPRWPANTRWRAAERGRFAAGGA